MIARTWHGRVMTAKADAYLAHLKRTGLSEFRSTAGKHGGLRPAARRGRHHAFHGDDALVVDGRRSAARPGESGPRAVLSARRRVPARTGAPRHPLRRLDGDHRPADVVDTKPTPSASETPRRAPPRAFRARASSRSASAPAAGATSGSTPSVRRIEGRIRSRDRRRG